MWTDLALSDRPIKIPIQPISKTNVLEYPEN
jgi:hypothetical protein